MRFTASCDCKWSINKRKKTATMLSLCEKHRKEMMRKIHEAMFGKGFKPSFPTCEPFGKSILAHSK